MSTTPTTTPASPIAPVPRTRWGRFWFSPADPTTLGFIRLVTGFTVLYVHLAYCFDLQAFFGPDGWYGLQYSNRERLEGPTQVSDFWGDDAWRERLRGRRCPSTRTAGRP